MWCIHIVVGQLPILCGRLLAEVVELGWICFFKYFMWKMNVNFLLNIAPKILYLLTTGISVSSSLMRGSLCIFLSWQKCMHQALLLEIVKPFVLAQWVIFRMHCCSWHFAYIWIWKWCRNCQHTGNPQFQEGDTLSCCLFLYWIVSLRKYFLGGLTLPACGD